MKFNQSTMKKMIVSMVAITILGGTIAVADTNKMLPFSDMNAHWSTRFVYPLADQGIIGGYADGTFKPDNTIKRIEYIVLTLKALNEDVRKTQEGEYWGQPYIEKAIEIGLLVEHSLNATDYETMIKRQEMASIIIRAYKKEIANDNSNFLSGKVKELISDLYLTQESYEKEVILAYALNFIGGYPDGNFKPNGNASRAEAAVVIAKLLDDSLRNPIEISDEPEPEVLYNEEGEVIRTAHLPKNADLFPYVLERIPNIVYEAPSYYLDDAKVLPRDYQDYLYTLEDYQHDSLPYFENLIMTNVSHRLNVDYRTIDNAWAEVLYETYDPNHVRPEWLQECYDYVQFVKDHKIIIKSNAIITDESLAFNDSGTYFRTYVNYDIVQFENVPSDQLYRIVEGTDPEPYNSWVSKRNYEGVVDIGLGSLVGSNRITNDMVGIIPIEAFLLQIQTIPDFTLDE